uniref:Putative par domain protein n=1 Tax=Schistosoma mansoni TaxID=6183 RepID=A0A3Q0KS48_SCHMA
MKSLNSDTNQCSPSQDSHLSSSNKIPDDVNVLDNESYTPVTSSIMTIPYNLNLNWVSPIITALSMSASPSILNLTSDLSHSISSSQIVTSSSSPSSLLMSCFPQIATKVRASSCFPLGRQLDNVSLLSPTYPQTNINADNLINHDQDDDKPLDLTLKSFTTVKSSELTEKKLDNENSKIPCRRKSSRTHTQTKTTSSTTTKTTKKSEKLNQSNQDTQTNRQVEIIQQSESITSSSTNNINGIELCQNNWIGDIQDLIQTNESDQKRPRSTSSRRPFKAFGNTVPSISTEILLKSSKLIDPLLLVNTIDKSEKDNDSKSIEHTEQKTTSITPPHSPTPMIFIPTTNGNNSRRKPIVKIKSRRSQSASPLNQIENINDNNKTTTVDKALSTTKSLETLCKHDKSVVLLPTTTTTTTTTTAQSVRSISSTPSCYSSYSELIDANNNNNNNNNSTANNNNDSTNIIHTDCNPRMRRFPEMTPSEVKDKAYWEKRVKNNEAARRSRRARKTKELSLKKYADNLEKVNLKLIEEIDLLKQEILHLKAEKNKEKLT